MSRHRAQAIAALAVALLSLSALVVANQLLERGDDNSDARLSWSLLKALGPSKRSGHSLTIIGGGIYVFGGCYLDTACYSDLYIFNLAQKAWLRPVPRGHLPDARGHHTASAINQTLWIVGGSNDGEFRGDVYTFDTQTWLWSKPLIRGEHKLTPRHGHSAVVYGNKIIIYGGYGDKGYRSDVYILDTVNRVWIKPQKVTGVPPSPRSGHVSVRHKNRMYVFGGVSDATGDTNTFHAYDIVANDWLAPSQLLNSGPIPSARHGAVAAMWKDMMFLVGGCNYVKRECYNDTTVLDMSTMQWNLLDVRSEFVPNKTKPFDPKDLIDEKTLQLFSQAPPAPPAPPPAVAKAKEEINLAIEAKQMAQFAAEQAALAAKNKTGSSFLQLGARHRMAARHRSRDGPSGNVLPPLMDIGEEAKLPNVDGAVQWHLSPVGGLAGGFHGNTGDLFVFGGCFLEKSCSFKLLQLTIPKTYKPPVDPFPIPNTVTKSGNALSSHSANDTNGLAPMQPIKELPPAVAPVIPPVPRFAQLNTVDVDRFAELGDNLAALALAASQRAPSVGKSNTDIDDVDSPISRLLSSGRPTTFVEEQPPSSESASPPPPSHPARRRRARRPIKRAPAHAPAPAPAPAPAAASEAAEESAKEAHIAAKKPKAHARSRSRGHPLNHRSHVARLADPVVETSQLSVWGIAWRILLALGVIGTVVLCCFKAYLYYDEKKYNVKRSDLRNVTDSEDAEPEQEEPEDEEAPIEEEEEEEDERPARKGKKKVTIKEPPAKAKKSSSKSARAIEEETAEASAVLGAALGGGKKKDEDEPKGPSPEKMREYQEYARRIATSVDLGADYSDDD